jgi:glutathione peroxidase
MKRLIMGFLMLGWVLGATQASADAAEAMKRTAFDFSFEAIDGSPMPLKAYAGKVLLVVNTASDCGFTGQYEGLEALWQAYKDKGLVVIGVPSNDFGGQEPGSNAEIKQFCESRYRVTFPMAGKTVVKGKDAHPFYGWAEAALDGDGTPSWNFHKYLIGRDGKVKDYFSSMTGPSASSLKKAVEAAL